LRRLLHEPVQLGGARLIEPRLLLEAEDADRLQDAQGADAVGVRRVFGVSKLTATWLIAARL
jgi:hypothetical protein